MSVSASNSASTGTAAPSISPHLSNTPSTRLQNAPTAPSTSTSPSTLPHSPETLRQIAEARTALEASMNSIGTSLSADLQSRAQNLHANSAQLDKQMKDVEKSTQGLRKETDNLGKLAKEGEKRMKELGNVQNWAEMLERDFLVLEETLRLAKEGSGSESGSYTGSSGSWTGSEDGERDEESLAGDKRRELIGAGFGGDEGRGFLDVYGLVDDGGLDGEGEDEGRQAMDSRDDIVMHDMEGDVVGEDKGKGKERELEDDLQPLTGQGDMAMYPADHITRRTAESKEREVEQDLPTFEGHGDTEMLDSEHILHANEFLGEEKKANGEVADLNIMPDIEKRDTDHVYGDKSTNNDEMIRPLLPDSTELEIPITRNTTHTPQ